MNITLAGMLGEVYGVPKASVLGGPTWMRSKGFDVRAKTVDVIPVDESKLPWEQRDVYNAQKQVPIQKMLEERFKLKVHFEKREQPILVLKVWKDGPRLRPAAVEDNPRTRLLIRQGTGMIQMSGLTMDQLAAMLSQINTETGGRPVQNQTGLPGHFDINVTWATDTSIANIDAPLLKRALEETLGLTIESQKGMVPVLIIDHVEEPTEN